MKYKASCPSSYIVYTAIVCNTNTHTHLNSIYWEEYYGTRDYPTLFHSSTPRLVDPANPANNVYLSGIGPYPRRKKASEYDLGDGDWSQFVSKVEYFDLEKSVEEIAR